MRFHEIPWSSMRFYDVSVNRSVPTEANRGLTSYTNSFVVLLASLRITQGNRFDWHTGRKKAIQAKKQSEAPASLSCLVNSCLVTGRSIWDSLLIIELLSLPAGVSTSLQDMASALPLTFPGR
jgi:hypothetical protein